MLNLRTACACATVFAITSCSSSSSSSGSSDLQARIDTVKNCFPETYTKLGILLQVAETWRLNTTTNPSDPAGLTWSELADGSIQVDWAVASCPLDMQLNFFDSSGVRQDLDLTGATSLSDVLDIATNALAIGSSLPFLTADWTLKRGTTQVILGAGTFTGILGGTTGQRVLERLSTTLGSSTVNGGPPTAASATISTENVIQCVTRVSMPDLQIDTVPGQQYPGGVVTFSITGPQVTVDATVTFDQTNMATIDIGGVILTINLDSLVFG